MNVSSAQFYATQEDEMDSPLTWLGITIIGTIWVNVVVIIVVAVVPIIWELIFVRSWPRSGSVAIFSFCTDCSKEFSKSAVITYDHHLRIKFS